MTDDNEEGLIQYAEDVLTQEAPDPLPAGDYPWTIETAVRKTSQSTGEDYLAVTGRISVEDFPPDFNIENAPDGVVLSYNRLSPKNSIKDRFRMRKFLEAIGAPGGMNINPNDWIGLRAVAEVTVGEYDGMPQNQIKKVKAA